MRERMKVCSTHVHMITVIMSYTLVLTWKTVKWLFSGHNKVQPFNWSLLSSIIWVNFRESNSTTFYWESCRNLNCVTPYPHLYFKKSGQVLALSNWRCDLIWKEVFLEMESRFTESILCWSLLPLTSERHRHMYKKTTWQWGQKDKPRIAHQKWGRAKEKFFT